jgi:hypothetical protein
MPSVEVGGGEGGRAGRLRRTAARVVEGAQRIGRGLVDRFRGRRGR